MKRLYTAIPLSAVLLISGSFSEVGNSKPKSDKVAPHKDAIRDYVSYKDHVIKVKDSINAYCYYRNDSAMKVLNNTMPSN